MEKRSWVYNDQYLEIKFFLDCFGQLPGIFGSRYDLLASQKRRV